MRVDQESFWLGYHTALSLLEQGFTAGVDKGEVARAKIPATILANGAWRVVFCETDPAQNRLEVYLVERQPRPEPDRTMVLLDDRHLAPEQGRCCIAWHRESQPAGVIDKCCPHQRVHDGADTGRPAGAL